MAGIQFNMRLTPELNEKLRALAKRWGSPPSTIIRTCIAQLYRRDDIRSPLDIEKEIAGAVDALVTIRRVADKALKAAGKG